MNWRALLAKILGQNPGPAAQGANLPALLEDASDRRGMLNRRAFLQIAGSVAVAAAVIDPEALIWTPRPIVVVGELPFNTLDWMTREALRVITNQLSFGKYVNREYDGATVACRIGDRVTVGGRRRLLTDQLSVSLAESPRNRQEAKIVADDAAAAFLRGAEDRGLKVFAPLPLPAGVDRAIVMTDAKHGVSLRGVQMYNLGDDLIETRFDMLGARA